MRMDINNFLERLHKEKLDSQKRRADFNIRKFVFIGSLFTIGAAKLPNEIDLNLVLYIVPLISICFDLFILGEDYGIKRFGAFIGLKCRGTKDAEWEKWVSSKRDPFSVFAIPFLTILVLIACIAVLYEKEQSKTGFKIWVISNVIATLFLVFYSLYLKYKLYKNNKK